MADFEANNKAVGSLTGCYEECSTHKNSLPELVPEDRLYPHYDGLVEEHNNDGKIYGRECPAGHYHADLVHDVTDRPG